jgi:hypothetical protein
VRAVAWLVVIGAVAGAVVAGPRAGHVGGAPGAGRVCGAPSAAGEVVVLGPGVFVSSTSSARRTVEGSRPTPLAIAGSPSPWRRSASTCESTSSVNFRGPSGPPGVGLSASPPRSFHSLRKRLTVSKSTPNERATCAGVAALVPTSCPAARRRPTTSPASKHRVPTLDGAGPALHRHAERRSTTIRCPDDAGVQPSTITRKSCREHPASECCVLGPECLDLGCEELLSSQVRHGARCSGTGRSREQPGRQADSPVSLLPRDAWMSPAEERMTL